MSPELYNLVKSWPAFKDREEIRPKQTCMYVRSVSFSESKVCMFEVQLPLTYMSGSPFRQVQDFTAPSWVLCLSRLHTFLLSGLVICFLQYVHPPPAISQLTYINFFSYLVVKCQFLCFSCFSSCMIFWVVSTFQFSPHIVCCCLIFRLTCWLHFAQQRQEVKKDRDKGGSE